MMLKDDAEHPVPDDWRTTFQKIASAFAAGDYDLRKHPIAEVATISAATAQHIASNVAAYGEPLAPLNHATWGRSVYRWMGGYWQVLVDLTTVAEPVSDLTIHAKLREGNGARLEIESVHVP